MKANTYITGYYPAMKNRFLVVMGGTEEMVKAFNRGEFGPYAKAAEGYKKGTFKLERETIEMY